MTPSLVFDKVRISPSELPEIDKVIIIACGAPGPSPSTQSSTGRERRLERRMSFRYRDLISGHGRSPSAIYKANVSTIPPESGVLYTLAGPEVAVASAMHCGDAVSEARSSSWGGLSDIQ